MKTRNYGRTKKNRRKPLKETWMDKAGGDYDRLHLGKFEKLLPTFFTKFYQCISKCQLYSWIIILSFYVAVILQMKDSCSASLTLRAQNYQN